MQTGRNHIAQTTGPRVVSDARPWMAYTFFPLKRYATVESSAKKSFHIWSMAWLTLAGLS